MAKVKTPSAPKQNPMKSTAMASLVGMISVIAILAIAWAFVASPYLEEQKQSKADIAALETEQNSLTVQIASLQKTKEMTPAIEEYDKTLTNHFPTEAEANAMREGIYRLAEINNVFVNVGMSAPTVIDQAAPGEAAPPVEANESTEPTEPVATVDGEGNVTEGTTPATSSPDTGSIAQIDVTLTVSGTYDNVGKFLDSFYIEFQRGFIIDSFSVSGGAAKAADGGEGEANNYNVAISGKTFLYKATLSPSDIIKNDASPSPAPSAVPTESN